MIKETENLMTLGRLYSANKKQSLRTLATKAANGGAFFDRLAKGKTITVRKYYNLIQWFSDNWPADLDWPKDIERPEPRKEAA